MRVEILQSYVSDLTDQNAVLVKTVEDLEVDANDRVARLETRLLKASGVIKVIYQSINQSINQSIFKVA